VLETLSAVPVVVVSVLLEPVTLTVPPPAALNAPFVPVEATTPPLRLTVAPVFELRLMPVPVSLIAPLKATVPLERLATETELPLEVVIEAPIEMSPPAAPEREPPPPVALVIEPEVPVSKVDVVTLEPLRPAPLVLATLTPWVSEPFASWIPAPPAFWMTGLVPPAETRLGPLTVRPFVWPHRFWFDSSGSPPV